MRMYEYDFSRRLATDGEFRIYIMSLKGKKLGCYCKKHRSDSDFFALDTTVCHGEIISNYINTVQEIV